MRCGKLFENIFAFGREREMHLTPIGARQDALDKCFRRQTVRKTDGAVMANLQSLCKLPDRDRFASRETFDGEHCLVMLRCNAGQSR